MANEAIKIAPDTDKPFLSLHYQQLLTAIGSNHRTLRNFKEAENYLKEALDFPVLKSPATGHLKFMGSAGGYAADNVTTFTLPSLIGVTPKGEYHYRLEHNVEMLMLKIQENKQDEALSWYEKAMQVSQNEHGNDAMGVPFTEFNIKQSKNIDFKKFMTIREKYFPNAEKVD